MTQASFDFTGQHEGKLEAKFWEFHADHPRVYVTLRALANQWRERRGPDARLGIAALYERARWEFSLGDPNEEPRLNNNHRAFYARLLMDREPDLRDLFSLRQQRIEATFGPENVSLPEGGHLS